MSITDIKQSLRDFCGGAGVITKAQLMKFLGVKNPSVAEKYLSGLESIDGKYYLIGDVSGRL